jgi:hypothetical protein
LAKLQQQVIDLQQQNKDLRQKYESMNMLQHNDNANLIKLHEGVMYDKQSDTVFLSKNMPLTIE